MEGHASEGHRFLEHVTDAFIEAWGETFEKALAQAAIGFFETIVDVNRIKPALADDIVTTGHDELELLYNWLEELLLKFELRGMVFSQFQVDPIQTTNSTLHLKAQAKGEPFVPTRHAGRVEVKGVTYHLMSVHRTPGRVILNFILDL